MSPRRDFGRVYQKTRRDGTAYPGWYVRYVEGGARVERSGFPTRDAAEVFLAARLLERGQRRAVGLPDLRRVRVSAAVEDYLAHLRRHRRPSTVSAAQTHLRGFAATLDRDLVDVRREDVARHLEHLRRDKRYAPATLRLVLAIVSGLFRHGVEHGIAREIVTKGLAAGLPRIDTEAPPYLAPDELRVIYAACPESIRAAVVLMGEAGLRRNEAIYLRHGEIRRDGSAVTIGGARSKGHRARTVPLTQTAREALAAVLADHAVPISAETRVFGVARSQFGRDFAAAMQRIGRPEVTPRTLRHAFGSGAAMAGVDMEIIRRLMGHRSIVTTQIYAQHRPRSAEESAIRALEAHRAPPSSSSDSQRRNAT